MAVAAICLTRRRYIPFFSPQVFVCSLVFLAERALLLHTALLFLASGGTCIALHGASLFVIHSFVTSNIRATHCHAPSGEAGGVVGE